MFDFVFVVFWIFLLECPKGKNTADYLIEVFFFFSKRNFCCWFPKSPFFWHLFQASTLSCSFLFFFALISGFKKHTHTHVHTHTQKKQKNRRSTVIKKVVKPQRSGLNPRSVRRCWLRWMRGTLRPITSTASSRRSLARGGAGFF